MTIDHYGDIITTDGTLATDIMLDRTWNLMDPAIGILQFNNPNIPTVVKTVGERKANYVYEVSMAPHGRFDSIDDFLVREFHDGEPFVFYNRMTEQLDSVPIEVLYDEFHKFDKKPFHGRKLKEAMSKYGSICQKIFLQEDAVSYNQLYNVELFIQFLAMLTISNYPRMTDIISVPVSIGYESVVDMINLIRKLLIYGRRNIFARQCKDIIRTSYCPADEEEDDSKIRYSKIDVYEFYYSSKHGDRGVLTYDDLMEDFRDGAYNRIFSRIGDQKFFSNRNIEKIICNMSIEGRAKLIKYLFKWGMKRENAKRSPEVVLTSVLESDTVIPYLDMDFTNTVCFILRSLNEHFYEGLSCIRINNKTYSSIMEGTYGQTKQHEYDHGLQTIDDRDIIDIHRIDIRERDERKRWINKIPIIKKPEKGDLFYIDKRFFPRKFITE